MISPAARKTGSVKQEMLPPAPKVVVVPVVPRLSQAAEEPKAGQLLPGEGVRTSHPCSSAAVQEQEQVAAAALKEGSKAMSPTAPSKAATISPGKDTAGPLVSCASSPKKGLQQGTESCGFLAKFKAGRGAHTRHRHPHWSFGFQAKFRAGRGAHTRHRCPHW